MIGNITSCGCNKSTQSKTTQVLSPIINNCEKTPKIAHIEGKGEYEVHALVNTDSGQAFLPVTSTKAVFDECGNNLDSILKKFQDVLAEFNTTNLKFQDYNGNVHNLEMVLNCNVKVVDDFNTDSGAKALSARRGKYLYDALSNDNSDVHFVDDENGNTSVRIKEDSVANITNIRGLINGMTEKIDQYTQQCDVLFSLLSTLVKPSLLPVAISVSTKRILRRELITNGSQIQCKLGLLWNLDTNNTSVITSLTNIHTTVKWYNDSNELIDYEVLDSRRVRIEDRGIAKFAICDVPYDASYCTLSVTVHYNELELTSDIITYRLVDEYSLMEDFTLVGVDHIEGIDTGNYQGCNSYIENGKLWRVGIDGSIEANQLERVDTLYYSFKQMHAMGKESVDETVPLYYYSQGRLIQINEE